jgi:hypothetical protein
MERVRCFLAASFNYEPAGMTDFRRLQTICAP